MNAMVYLFLSDMIIRRRNLATKTNVDVSSEFSYEVDIIAENLYIPWAIDISNEGKIYFTERSGKIRVIEEGTLIQQPLITFAPPFVAQGEGGLMGIVLDPKYSENHYIYVMYSYLEENQIYNQVVRLVEENSSAYIDRVLIDNIPGGRIHNGGRIKIGPDNKLYITTGDAGNPALAQDINSLAGKILRIELDGGMPEDNPFYNSPVYSYGHRNPQGITWSSENIMYASEHGQTAHDEINIIKPGANYGWPLVQGDEVPRDIEVQKPLIDSGQDTWAPSGIAYIDQGPWQDKLLVANLRGEQLLLISLNEEGTAVTDVDNVLKNQYGRLRGVFQEEDGAIYITTSNKDGRGRADSTDDKIIRLTP